METESCQCKILRDCVLGEACECMDYCLKYKSRYLSIVDGGKFCYMTISPKPNPLLGDEDKMSLWMEDFSRLSSCVKDIILVVEYTKKMILHYHLLVKLKDPIKWRKGFVQRWYYDANIEPIYNIQPKHGIHYFFKETNTTSQILGTKSHFVGFSAIKDYVKEYPTPRAQMFGSEDELST